MKKLNKSQDQHGKAGILSFETLFATKENKRLHKTLD
jgi:hypothetical protein